MARTHFDSPIFLGAPLRGEVSRANFLSAHFGSGANQPAGFPTLVEGHGGGVMMAPYVYMFNCQPLALNAANIAASQSPAAGAITLAAAAGVTAVVVNGVTRYRMDMPRALQIVSGGNDTGINFTINGYNIYGDPLQETQAGANAGAKNFNKAFYEVVSVTHTGSVATTVTVGTRDVIGLPYRCDLWEQLELFFNGALLTASTGFTAAVTTDPATASTGDTRGTYALQSAADGTKRLFGAIMLPQLGTQNPKLIYGVTDFGG